MGEKLGGARAGESWRTMEPGSQEIVRSQKKFLMGIPRICQKNVTHLRQPKIHKQTIISHKK